MRLGQDIITLRASGDADWTLDEEVGLCIDRQAVLVFSGDTEQLLDI